MSSDLAVLPGATGSRGLRKGPRTRARQRAGRGRVPRRANSSRGEAGALPRSTGSSDPRYFSHFSSMSLQRTFFSFVFRHSVYASDTDYFILTNLFSQSALTESLLKLNYNQIITSKDTLIT